jgi:hypothetical protein
MLFLNDGNLFVPPSLFSNIPSIILTSPPSIDIPPFDELTRVRS